MYFDRQGQPITLERWSELQRRVAEALARHQVIISINCPCCTEEIQIELQTARHREETAMDQVMTRVSVKTLALYCREWDAAVASGSIDAQLSAARKMRTEIDNLARAFGV